MKSSEVNLPAEPSKKEFKPIADYLSSKGMSKEAVNSLRTGNMYIVNNSEEGK